ncbi:MAG: hypothetical protein ACK417_01225 [Bacteroidia bacterium]
MKTLTQAIRLMCMSLVVIGAFYSKAAAQSTLRYNSDAGKFESNERLAYGRIILIEGVSQAPYQSVALYVRVNTQEPKKVDVAVQGKSWTAELGPFPVNAQLIFTIKEVQLMTETLAKAFAKEYVRVIELSMDYAIKHGLVESTFSQVLYGMSSRSLSDRWLQFRSRTEVRLDSAIVIQAASDAKFTELMNYAQAFKPNPMIGSRLNGIKDTVVSINQKLEDPIFYLKMDDAGFEEFMDSLKGALDSLTYVGLTSLMKTSRTGYKTHQQKQKELYDFLEAIALDAARTSYKTTEVNSSAEVLGLHRYVGSDLGLMVIPGLGRAPVFALFSPHLRKIEPDRDYRWCSDGWQYFIAPSLGLGLGQGLSGLEPVYYTGLSLRQNTAIRYHLGAVYFRNDTRNRFDSYFSGGISISLHYLPDFLRMFNSAQANL